MIVEYKTVYLGRVKMNIKIKEYRFRWWGKIRMFVHNIPNPALMKMGIVNIAVEKKNGV